MNKKNIRKVYLASEYPEEVNVDEIVFTKVNSIMNRQSESNWTGTMTNLRTALNKVSSRRQRDVLPGSPSALRVVINRVVNRLRNGGIGVRFGRTARTRYVRFSH